jgi:hypothetical protein
VARELYNHTGDSNVDFDAFENINVAEQNPDIAATLSEQLHAAFQTA